MPIILILIVLIIVLLIMNIRIVPQSYQYVVEHLGRYKTTWDAGVKFLIPFMDRVAKKVSLKEQVVDFPLPAGPVTKIIPLETVLRSMTESGMPRSLGSGREKVMILITAAREPLCLYVLTRKRESPGMAKEKSSSPEAKKRSMFR